MTLSQLAAELGPLLTAGGLIKGRLWDPVVKDGTRTVRIHPVALKEGMRIQVERLTATKAFQENFTPDAFQAWLADHGKGFRQGQLTVQGAEWNLAIRADGTLRRKIRSLELTAAVPVPGHDRAKHRLLAEGHPVPFLVELGIMSPEGRVRKEGQDKYRQINRFLEQVAAVEDHLPQDGALRIVDFGSGKAYLSFALHHWFTVTKGRTVELTGLDLKEDVVAFCNDLARKIGAEGLAFRHGDIADYRSPAGQEPHLLVTLHACDTATDLALAEAIARRTGLILSVPCCQHELFAQVKSKALGPLLHHGLFKERFSALATDALRVLVAETLGYQAAVTEFIDPEHTPKNIMLRLVRTAAADGPPRQDKLEAYRHFRDFLGAEPALERALAERGINLG